LPVLLAYKAVFGDLSASHQHAVAFSTSLHGDTPQADAPLLVFIHGLCLHEQRWDSPAHRAFTHDLRQQGVRVSYLRYNSGLPIADNARQLAHLLETVPASRIMLVG